MFGITDLITFLIGTVTGLTAPGGVGSSPREDEDGHPGWICNPPEIPDYLVGIGVSQR